MSDEQKYDIHDAQDWVKSAPVEDVNDFLNWARGVVEIRKELTSVRKRRSDAGTSRKKDTEPPLLQLREDGKP